MPKRSIVPFPNESIPADPMQKRGDPHIDQWDPLAGMNIGKEGQREQRYLKRIRPRSANQEKLQTAIRENALVFAVGPRRYR